MLKELLFMLLGINKKNQKVQEIKRDLQIETNAIIKTTNKLNTAIKTKGVTYDISFATGKIKKYGI